MSAERDDEVGSLCLVLHSHLPWVAHHGRWPVGEEWLYQAWAGSYLPMHRVLRGLAADGFAGQVTLGITPVLASMLDDEHCLDGAASWVANWQLRAGELAAHGSSPMLREAGRREHAEALRAADDLATTWRAGGSAAWRELADSGVVEILGGPATHAFTPLTHPRVARFGLRTGLDDATLRLGRRPAGIWLPECGYSPGLERLFAAEAVQHLMLEGPTLQHVGAAPHSPWLLGDTDVTVFGRDLPTTYRVWSPRRGYPSAGQYRDFHAFHHESGFRPYRVTNTRTPSDRKRPYDPDLAAYAVRRDAHDFVDSVRERLQEHRQSGVRRPIVVAAYDTELFGHWWHEGPQWLDQVLRLLPEAGIRARTLADASATHAPAGRVHPEAGSWGSGKDFHVWAGPAVHEMVDENAAMTERWLKWQDGRPSVGIEPAADPVADQAAREGLLALSSDWAFMVSKDSAAGYARERHRGHHDAFTRLTRDAASPAALRSALEQYRRIDRPLVGLDARLLSVLEDWDR